MRRLIAILLMLWFPVQGWAALAMPFCQHSANAAVAVELAAPMNADHCQHHVEQNDAADAKATSSLQCDQCTTCHLAHAPILLHPPVSLPAPVLAQRAESETAYYYQIFPEQPQRPPLSLV